MPATTTPNTSDISECIKSKDFLSMKDIGIVEGFGTNNTQRLRCYSILLGCGGLDVYDTNNKNENIDLNEYQNIYSKLIGRDIRRNGYCRWNKTDKYSQCQKEFDLSQIEKLLNIVFTEYPEFNYIQSFDSVFAVFYLISNGNLFIAKKLIVSYLHIFKSDLSLHSDNFGQLSSIWKILKQYDLKFYRWLASIIGYNCESEANVQELDVSFALEWYISWFAHSSISDFKTLLRIYDFMISTQNPQISLYIIIALLLLNKKKLMQNVENLTDFLLFTKTQIVFDAHSVSQIITKCHQIMQNEMKKEQRRNNWKNNKIEVNKTWKKILKKRTKALNAIFLL